MTPVFNNADDLPECIESVLGQTYQNWDYTIVNNCSRDGSGEIARRYAAKDKRIKVIDNKQFLRCVPNHNHALRQISPESKYCKIVFADDWIFPRCIQEMVGLAEEHPSVALVGAYGLVEDTVGGRHQHIVMWGGLPYPSRLVSGRDVCRRTFLEDRQMFGTSTSHLYRSDVVRERDPFYNEGNFHADLEACVVLLKTADFGFVHQILTFTRGRPGSLTTMAVDMRMELGCKLQILAAHGRDFLNPEEFAECQERLLGEYYNFLAVSVIRGRRDKKFWDFHKRKLSDSVGFSRARLARVVVARLSKAVLSPYETFGKLRGRKRRSVTGATSGSVDSGRDVAHVEGVRS